MTQSHTGRPFSCRSRTDRGPVSFAARWSGNLSRDMASPSPLDPRPQVLPGAYPMDSHHRHPVPVYGGEQDCCSPYCRAYRSRPRDQPSWLGTRAQA